jgi:hypothetical protein
VWIISIATRLGKCSEGMHQSSPMDQIYAT